MTRLAALRPGGRLRFLVTFEQEGCLLKRMEEAGARLLMAERRGFGVVAEFERAGEES